MLFAMAGYLGLGALGLSMAIPPGYASPIFPAAGFAVAVLLFSTRRAWPGIWLGSLALNMGVAWLHGELDWGSGLIAAGIASGSTLQALAASWLVRRSVGSGWQSLERERDILLGLALAGPVACVISASVGVSLLTWAKLLAVAEYPYAFWNWWLGDTLGVLVMLPLTLTLFYRRLSPWRARLMTLVLPMLFALGLVAGAFYAIARWEREEQKDAIRNHGEALAQVLEQRFIAHQEALSALRRLVEVNPGMGTRQFEYFTRITLKDNPDIFALSINPYVLLAQRRAFERSMAVMSGNPDFEIKDRDSERRLVRAADRPEYVAVATIAPLEGNRPALGFDINAEPLRHDAILRAKASGLPAVTAPIRLVQESRERIGVLLLHPAYRQMQDDAESKAELQSFAVGVIKVDQMVAIATHATAVPGLAFRLDDPLAAADSSLLYLSDSNSPAADEEYLWRKRITMADRHWLLTVSPTPGFLSQGRHWTVMLVGAGGLALAALLQILLLVTTGRTSLVQRKVKEQTAELTVKSSALEDRNAQLSALFTLCPDGFIAFAADGKVSFANPAFQTMTGIDLADLLGEGQQRLDAELRERCDRPQDFPGIAACFNPASPGSETVNLVRPRQVVLQMVGIATKSPNVSQVLYFHDVTHETEVDQMKSEFMSTAAHELRTPMASIYGFAEVLLTQDHDEASRREFLEIIFNQSELMASILNELLDLARIEARRGKDFVFEETPLQALVDEVVHGFKLPAGSMAPTLTAAPGPLSVIADRKKAQQAILNVLSNAYKYSPGGGAVAIELLGPGAGAPARHGIRIVDHGIGMTALQAGRVCERFYRADTSGNIPGTGLGMSIVKEIMDLHHGELEIASEPGQGSTVTLWFAAVPESGSGSSVVQLPQLRAA